MKADLSTNDIIRIQVVSRLSDLLFDELRKIKLDGAPPSALRIRLAARKRRRCPARYDRLVGRYPRRGHRFARR